MKNQQWKISALLILLSTNFNANAGEEILRYYEAQEKKGHPTFQSFSAAEGERIFRTERINAKGVKVSCMTCHTNDPKKEGLTRANKIVAPLAPVANSERFTNQAKVEKWFKRNCKDVYDRECTNTEKGHFTKWILSVK